MKGQAFNIILIGFGLLLLDFYVIGGIRGAFKKRKWPYSPGFSRAYWVLSVVLVIGMFISIYVKLGVGIRAATLMIFFLLFAAKACFLPFIVIDDIRRLILRLSGRFKKAPAFRPVIGTPTHAKAPAIPRSEFLMKAGVIAGSLPIVGLANGIISGAYDYHIRRQTLYLPHLPKAFDGIRLGQISDIHSGSFYNKTAVMGGVEMLLREKTDFIFFTGDLVNARTIEFRPYFDIFNKIKAPLGVYSSLGNHDYGDYFNWPDAASKQKNFEDIVTAHKLLGWDLLRNTNRRLKVNGEEIGILGVENWGELSRFPKYGRMDLATKNTDDLPVKLLLSHDPSHWQAQVVPHYPQIDVMFAGHTHGMQFGVRAEHFQWSPIKYVYKEWAGLYHQAQQQLYVNVGYGFLGYPGRVGILPEITIFTLKSGIAPAVVKA